MREGVSRHRSVSALLVDVPAGACRAAPAHARGRRLVRARACRSRAPRRSRPRSSAAAGRPSCTAATARRRCRRARRSRSCASPTRTCRSSPSRRTSAPATCPRCCAACPAACPTVSDLSKLPGVLTRELEQARMRHRVGGAHRLLAAQQAIGDHLAAGLEPTELCDRVLATLGESLSFTAGAIWRPDGAVLRCVTAVARAGRARRGGRAGQRDARADLRRRPGPPRPRVGVPAAGVDRRAVRRRAARRPRQRRRVPDRASATSASA